MLSIQCARPFTQFLLLEQQSAIPIKENKCGSQKKIKITNRGLNSWSELALMSAWQRHATRNRPRHRQRQRQRQRQRTPPQS